MWYTIMWCDMKHDHLIKSLSNISCLWVNASSINEKDFQLILQNALKFGSFGFILVKILACTW